MLMFLEMSFMNIARFSRARAAFACTGLVFSSGVHSLYPIEIALWVPAIPQPGAWIADTSLANYAEQLAGIDEQKEEF